MLLCTYNVYVIYTTYIVFVYRVGFSYFLFDPFFLYPISQSLSLFCCWMLYCIFRNFFSIYLYMYRSDDDVMRKVYDFFSSEFKRWTCMPINSDLWNLWIIKIGFCDLYSGQLSSCLWNFRLHLDVELKSIVFRFWTDFKCLKQHFTLYVYFVKFKENL